MLNLLIDSLKEISEDYVTYVNYAGNKCLHLERIFSYELYRRWADKLDNSSLNPNNLILHGEIVKGFEDRTRRYPDFVLHGSQGDMKHQEIVCEIKRNKNINRRLYVHDLNKLVEFFNSKKTFNHPFKYGVFILVGGSMNRIKQLSKSLPLSIIKISNRIIVISHRGKETFDPIEDVKFLSDIIK